MAGADQRNRGSRQETAALARDQVGNPAPPTGPPAVEGSSQAPPERSPQGRLPLWKRRANAAKRSGTTTRDLFSKDPFGVRVPPEVKRNVRFLWMSDLIWQRRPILTGFRYDNWQKVTPDVMKELNIEVDTKDRTSDQVPRVGEDAFLMWAPEELAQQYDEFVEEGARAGEMMRKRAQQTQDNLRGDGTGAIGEVTTSHDMREIHEAEAREREEIGTPFYKED